VTVHSPDTKERRQAVPVDRATPVRSLVRQLDASQWADAADIAASQFRHLVRLAEYCAAQSTVFASRLARAGLAPADLTGPVALSRLPPLTRRDVQTGRHDLYCRAHGAVTETRTSGSTGEPVMVRRTGVTTLFWQALAMRHLQWQRCDVSGRLCSVRANVSSSTQADDWGPPATFFGSTGPLLVLPIATDASRLADWISDFAPTTLVIYPNALDALTMHCRRQGVKLPHLRQVLTTGETLSPDVRASAETVLGATVTDCYSSQEFGYIAIECPDSGLYHVMAESVLVEVLRDDGTPCDVGEAGRVVVTDLHNYATPLVRYDIGDAAEVGPPCPCGRGLPTLTRVLGRTRNLVLLPDGTRHWPLTGFLRCRDVAPVLQVQLVQEDRHTVEARLVVERALSDVEEQRLTSLFQTAMGHPFALRLSYFPERIPAGAAGKYEEFVCRVAG
jgi:phenylacetate-CoA ligase